MMKSAVSTTLSLLALAVSPALARNFTVINKCAFTVWPAIYTDLNVGSAVPAVETGWQATSGSSRSFSVPDTWKAGRIWGRTECSFSSSGEGICATGGCDGGLACTGVSSGPTTLAEFTLGADAQDWTDVSLVDGFNLPLKVTNNVGCKTFECVVDLNVNCPAPLRALDSAGKTIGCKSSCAANLDGTPANSRNCCTGQYSTPATCPQSQVQYYSYFKSACPRTYVFPYDESSGTSLITCPSSKKPDLL
ncbi:pathogenesis-related protein PR5K (thaumatin family) [Ceratobasidium sp. AG-Ba]|nr:pathogenesis-related protein PR5K (thaumatin family) [Ceratobasidium sp. AG-Ba]QRW02418.1 pathogenesis-related protein PR5K (thaumatin family) [Ceratobasidium sp. AG-Ba]